MIKPKIYLSKSNATNPDDLFKVRSILDLHHCEMIEFSGGEYSHDEMEECDILLILPHTEQEEAPVDSFLLGKGQFSQIRWWYDECTGSFHDRNKRENVFIISTIGERNIYVDELTELQLSSNKNWKLNWGYAYTNQAMININNYGIRKSPSANPDFPDVSHLDEDAKHKFA